MNYLKEMKADELAEAIGKAWLQNDATTFISLFSEDAQIVHPYFKQAVAPSVAIEVINATVKPTTIMRKAKLLSGTGEGKDDVMELLFEESGNEIGRELGHIGEVAVTAEIKNHRFTKLIVHGFDVKTSSNSTDQNIYTRRDIGKLTSKEIASILALCWGSNDMDTFVSLFSSDAKIEHPGLDGEVTPQVVADIMNADVSVTSKLKSFTLLQGDGSGKEDLIELESDETGKEAGYATRHTGTMTATVSIKAHRIAHLWVHGYQVTDTEKHASPQFD
ncbi:MAG: hypothetical protein KME21_27950 [Desmonostoc vinosum HA7617-LM4]|jgi:uncharacterized protein with FMN-binding domain|nr:hypothetical protein [Desmonostoc vinosum HA7617-LM4]